MIFVKKKSKMLKFSPNQANFFPWVCPGGLTKIIFLFQIFKIYLFNDKNFIVCLILGHLKPKITFSRSWGLDIRGWGSKNLFGSSVIMRKYVEILEGFCWKEINNFYNLINAWGYRGDIWDPEWHGLKSS